MKIEIKQPISIYNIKSVFYIFLEEISLFFGKKWKKLVASGRKRR